MGINGRSVENLPYSAAVDLLRQIPSQVTLLVSQPVVPNTATTPRTATQSSPKTTKISSARTPAQTSGKSPVQTSSKATVRSSPQLSKNSSQEYSDKTTESTARKLATQSAPINTPTTHFTKDHTVTAPATTIKASTTTRPAAQLQAGTISESATGMLSTNEYKTTRQTSQEASHTVSVTSRSHTTRPSSSYGTSPSSSLSSKLSQQTQVAKDKCSTTEEVSLMCPKSTPILGGTTTTQSTPAAHHEHSATASITQHKNDRESSRERGEMQLY